MRTVPRGAAALCVLLTLICADQSQARVVLVPPGLRVATIPDSIRLTYLCGNRFQVRSYHRTVADVTWDVSEHPSDAGQLRLPARTAEHPYTETFFSTHVRGTTRLFRNGRLIQATLNGGTPCPVDPFPDTLPALPQAVLDSLPRLRIGYYPDSNVILSQVLIVTFEDSVTTFGKQAVRDSILHGSLLGAYTVGGPSLPNYVFRAPHATTFDSLYALLQRAKASPRVFTVEFFVLNPREFPSSAQGYPVSRKPATAQRR